MGTQIVWNQSLITNMLLHFLLDAAQVGKIPKTQKNVKVGFVCSMVLWVPQLSRIHS